MWLNGFTMVACFGFRLCRWRALLSILYEFRDGTLTRCGSEPMKVFRSCFAASFYLPSKCVRYFWLRLWHSTSSMKLHFVHFLPMLTLPWRNSRALIVTDANTRSFLLNGSFEHDHRLHSFIKNKSLSTNLNRELPRLSDLCFTNFITPIQTFYQDELRSRCFIVVIDMTPVLASRVSVATCATRILLLTCLIFY